MLGRWIHDDSQRSDNRHGNKSQSWRVSRKCFRGCDWRKAQRWLARCMLKQAVVVFYLHWKYTGKSCTGGDHCCSLSNGASSEMLFLGVSLAVKRSTPSHVSATSCRKGSRYFSLCRSPGGMWRVSNVHFSVLWQWGCPLTASISSS